MNCCNSYFTLDFCFLSIWSYFEIVLKLKSFYEILMEQEKQLWRNQFIHKVFEVIFPGQLKLIHNHRDIFIVRRTMQTLTNKAFHLQSLNLE